MIINGPGSAFELFFDEENSSDQQRGLPEAITAVYGGDWVLPDTRDGIYCYSNFVMSHDGRASFSVAGHEGGADVSAFNPHDQWLMGLLRARADAVIVGANTLRTESEHEWTSQFICPSDAEGFAQLRRLEGRQDAPVQVFVTRSGDITKSATVFHQKDLTSVIVTTVSGAERVASLGLRSVEVIVAGSHDVDLNHAIAELRRRFGVSSVLCEGGPRVYGAFVGAQLIDEEFLTLSPVLIGADENNRRPGLIEGLALLPASAHRARLLSVRRAGDHLFMRTAFAYTQV